MAFSTSSRNLVANSAYFVLLLVFSLSQPDLFLGRQPKRMDHVVGRR